jgi:MFS family permease
VALIAVLAPMGWFLARSTGNRKGASSDAPADVPALDGLTWQHALATPAFWVFSIGAALYGLVASGIGLFNESILAERGFGPNVYYQTLVVTAMTGLVGNFIGGWLARFVPLNRLMAISLLVLMAGLLALPHISTMTMAMAWAVMMGLGGGLVMVLFFSVWPRVYGRRQLGRIQGVAQAMTVLASAVGPLLLAACVEMTGSYAAMFYALSAAVGLLASAAAAVPMPRAQ